MEIQVALQYPNGRIHQTVYDTTRPIERGTEFDMHGTPVAGRWPGGKAAPPQLPEAASASSLRRNRRLTTPNVIGGGV